MNDKNNYFNLTDLMKPSAHSLRAQMAFEPAVHRSPVK
jgi:hypothetical protein